MVNQFNGAGINRVSTPSANALISITRPEKRTVSSFPLVATENMFPASATRVIPIIRIDHSSSAELVKPSNSLKTWGMAISITALKPNTSEPVCRTRLTLETALVATANSFVFA